MNPNVMSFPARPYAGCTQPCDVILSSELKEECLQVGFIASGYSSVITCYPGHLNRLSQSVIETGDRALEWSKIERIVPSQRSFLYQVLTAIQRVCTTPGFTVTLKGGGKCCVSSGISVRCTLLN